MIRYFLGGVAVVEGSGSQRICQGDSGGPLLATNSKGGYTLIGVHSAAVSDVNDRCGTKSFHPILQLPKNQKWFTDALNATPFGPATDAQPPTDTKKDPAPLEI